MESTQYIRAQLKNYTNADCLDQSVNNNRNHYHLKFEQSIGWDWVENQVHKVSCDLDVTLEMWKVRPSGLSSFEVEVREVERRKGIDDDQRGLNDFSRNS